LRLLFFASVRVLLLFVDRQTTAGGDDLYSTPVTSEASTEGILYLPIKERHKPEVCASENIIDLVVITTYSGVMYCLDY